MTQVLVCCGVGGTGKTTTAAALGLAHARAGYRTVVLTIDPARRLADALGVTLGNEPSAVDIGEGSLSAMMLDRKGTWDGIIRRFSEDEAHAERLLANPYYRAVSTRLSGSHEYMAIEKLYELTESNTWDLVVLDTPPAQHVLDFFQAPERVRGLLEHGVLSALLTPGGGLVGGAARGALSLLERIVGDTVIAGIREFFELMSGLTSTLRDRSAAVDTLLRSDRTRYLLVTDAGAPDRSDVLGFLGELRGRGMQFAGFLVNRTAPRPRLSRPLTSERLPALPEMTPAEAEAWVAALVDLPANAAVLARQHRENAQRLSRDSQHAPVWLVPELANGIRDLGGLERLVPHLPPRPPSPL